MNELRRGGMIADIVETVNRLAEAAELRNPQLDETVEQIVGDLCRAEDGQFSSCAGGGTATVEDEPNLPGLPRFVPEFTDEYRSFANPVPNFVRSSTIHGDKDSLDDVSDNLGKGVLRLTGYDEDAAPGTIHWLPDWSRPEGEKSFGLDLQIQTSDLLRAAGMPSGTTVEFFAPNTKGESKLLDADAEPEPSDDGTVYSADPDAVNANLLGEASKEGRFLLFRMTPPVEGDDEETSVVGALVATDQVRKHDGTILAKPELKVYFPAAHHKRGPVYAMLRSLRDQSAEAGETSSPLMIDQTIPGVEVVHDDLAVLEFERYGAETLTPKKINLFDFAERHFDLYGGGNVASDFEPVVDDEATEEAKQQAEENEDEDAESAAELEYGELPPGPERVATSLDELDRFGDIQLYHVTTAIEEVTQEGLMSLAELGGDEENSKGLGNPNASSPEVSFTTDPKMALNVEISLRGFLRFSQATDIHEAADALTAFFNERKPLAEVLASAGGYTAPSPLSLMLGLQSSGAIGLDASFNAALNRAMMMNLAGVDDSEAFDALGPRERWIAKHKSAALRAGYKDFARTFDARQRGNPLDEKTLARFAADLRLTGADWPTPEDDGKVPSLGGLIGDAKMRWTELLPTLRRFGGDKFRALPKEEQADRLDAYARKLALVDASLDKVKKSFFGDMQDGAHDRFVAKLLVKADRVVERESRRMSDADFSIELRNDEPVRFYEDVRSHSLSFRTLLQTLEDRFKPLPDPVIQGDPASRSMIDPDSVRTVYAATNKAPSRGSDTFNAEVVQRPGKVRIFHRPIRWEGFDFKKNRPDFDKVAA